MISLLLSLALLGAGTPVVRGVVHDPQGKPIPDAVVFLGYEGLTPNTTRTGPQGEFAIPDLAAPPADSDYRELVVHKSGWCLGGTSIRNIREAAEPVEIELAPSREVKLRVVAADGRPVSGAMVTPEYVACGKGDVFIGRAIGSRFATTSDGDGYCLLSSLAKLGGARVVVEHPAWGTQDSYFASAERAELTLLPVGRIVGQVTAEDPAAVRDLEIQADSQPSLHSSGGTSGTGPRPHGPERAIRDPRPGRRKSEAECAGPARSALAPGTRAVRGTRPRPNEGAHGRAGARCARSRIGDRFRLWGSRGGGEDLCVPLGR